MLQLCISPFFYVSKWPKKEVVLVVGDYYYAMFLHQNDYHGNEMHKLVYFLFLQHTTTAIGACYITVAEYIL